MFSSLTNSIIMNKDSYENSKGNLHSGCATANMKAGHMEVFCS
jgi:hypothetical protein